MLGTVTKATARLTGGMLFSLRKHCARSKNVFKLSFLSALLLILHRFVAFISGAIIARLGIMVRIVHPDAKRLVLLLATETRAHANLANPVFLDISAIKGVQNIVTVVYVTK